MMIRKLLTLIFCTMAFSAYAADPGTIDIVVPSRDVPRGTVLSEGDLAYRNVPANGIGVSVVRAMADVLGQETRRAFRAGEALRLTDVKHPTMVAKGAMVTMIFEAPGISLSATGRAMNEGGEGDSITVLNPVSYRQVQATVIGPGTVRVGMGQPGQMASAR